MTITVYTKPSCVQCNATYRALDSKGIEYEVLDLSDDESALAQVKALGLPAGPGRHHRRRPLVGLPSRQDRRTRHATRLTRGPITAAATDRSSRTNGNAAKDAP